MNKLCKNCELRNSCKKLCDEAEKYVKQDYVGKNHIEYVPAEAMKDIPDQEWPTGLSTPEVIIQYFFKERMTQAEIAKKLKISRQCVSRNIKKYRDEIKKIMRKTVTSRLISR